MRISVDNFKTLKSLEEFEFKPLTIITGVNSSGKSSFIQLLLLIKQTLQSKTVDNPLKFNDGVVQLGTFREVIYQKDTSNKLTLVFSFDRDEYNFPEINPLKIESFELKVSFASEGKEVAVEVIEFHYYIPETYKKDQFLKFEISGDKYLMTANTGLFNNDFFLIPGREDKEHLEGNVLFSNFFPQLFTTQIINPDYSEEPDSNNETETNELDKLLEKTKSEPFKQYSIEPNTKDIEEFITKWFQNISYIGPLRDQPKDFYLANNKDNGIGNLGEFAAYILEKEAHTKIGYLKMQLDSEGVVSFSPKEETLLDAVNHWICEIFKLAKKIYSVKIQDNYQVLIENNYGIETTIKHVGFGISQVLPIVVEGLRMSKGSILVLEQPEIHLHPKIQGLLFDFFYSLILVDKKILIETHSDHLLVRMRRRIAEDQNNELVALVNLEFVEVGDTNHFFDKVELTELGSIREFPKDFIEQQDDYRAIVKAQAKKKLNKK